MKTRASIAILVIVLAAILIVGWSAANRTPAPAVPGSENATSTPDTIQSDQAAVTQADNGKTVTVKVGSRFVLKLGEEQWTVDVSDPTVIRRLPNFMMVRGAQGIYQVLKPGTTTLSAQGRPVCNAGEMCAQYIVNFSTTIQAI